MSNAALLEFHAFCLTNTGSRLDQYARALADVVRPGDTVLDLGTGAGLLALLACRAGATLVYAVDSSESIRFGEILASASDHAERIEFVKATSTQLALARQVQVIVADIHDTFGLQAGGLQTMFDARDRFLAPGGSLIPTGTRLLVAPVEAPAVYARDIDIWNRRVQGVDLSPLRPFSVNQVHAARFESNDLLDDPEPLADLDYATSTSLLVRGTATGVVGRNGIMHGICGCFVTTLTPGVTVSNVPGDSGTTNFAQAFLPLSRGLPVAAGDRVLTQIDSRDGHAVRWRVSVARPGRAPYASFDHSSLDALPLSSMALRKQDGDYRPELTPAGRMERALLDRFDGRSTAAELESWLAETFGSVLPSSREMTSFLKSVIERCG